MIALCHPLTQASRQKTDEGKDKADDTAIKKIGTFFCSDTFKEYM
jgi:hypothetical protein